MVDCNPSIISARLVFVRISWINCYQRLNLSPSGKSFIDKAIKFVTVRSNMPRVRNRTSGKFDHISSLESSRLKAAIDSIGKIRY